MPKETFHNLPEDKRRGFLDIALEEFSDNDYKNVSISRLVRRAGIAKGSFYQYFENKKDLYLYLIELAMQEKTEFFAANPPPQPDMGVFDYIRWLYRIGVQFEFRNARMAKIGYRAIYGDAPLPEDTMRVIEEGNNRFFTSLISKGKASGHIRQDVNIDIAAFMFNAVFNNLGDFMMKQLGIAPETLMDNLSILETGEGEALFTSVVDMLENGMGTGTTKEVNND